MSNMLEEAIVDAGALREAAQKNAQEKIIEHFSNDIREAVDKILEQDMFGATDPFANLMGGPAATMAPTTPYSPMAPPTGAGMGAPMGPGAAPGMIDMPAEGKEKVPGDWIVEQTPYAATTADNAIVSLDLNRLEESIQRDLDETEDLDEDDLYEEEYSLEETDLPEILFDPKTHKRVEEEQLEEDEDPEAVGDTDEGIEGMGDSGFEAEGDLTGISEMIRGILAEDDDGDYLEEDDDTLEEDDDMLEEDDDPRDDFGGGHGEYARAAAKPDYPYRESKQLQENKQNTNKLTKLNEQNNRFRTLIQHLKEDMERVNLSNAKLLYQNRVLDSASLNERQKDRIVETIANAKTVEEAKIIYETLQSTVGADVSKRKPKSLNEVVTKRSSAFMPRKEEKKVDAFSERMKILAGLNKN